MELTVCPECQQGKHPNCAGWAFNEQDELVPCNCPECKVTSPA